MPGLTNQELTILIRALSFYGQDLAKNDADTEKVLSLICEFSHYKPYMILNHPAKGEEDED